jgi:hypothetical protein
VGSLPHRLLPSLRDSLILVALTQHLRAGLSYAAASRLVWQIVYAGPLAGAGNPQLDLPDLTGTQKCYENSSAFRLLHKFTLSTAGPGVVGYTEAHAIRNRWMIVEQKHIYGIRIWIGEAHFA